MHSTETPCKAPWRRACHTEASCKVDACGSMLTCCDTVTPPDAFLALPQPPVLGYTELTFTLVCVTRDSRGQGGRSTAQACTGV